MQNNKIEDKNINKQQTDARRILSEFALSGGDGFVLGFGVDGQIKTGRM